MAIRSRIQRFTLAFAVALVLLGGGVVPPADAARTRVAVKAALSCAAAGGANVTYTVRNAGTQTVHLGDLHFYLTRMTRGGPQGGGVVFLFPSPDYAVIPPGESRTWVVGIGTAMPGEPGEGTDLSAQRLILETEAWMEGY